MPLYQPKRMPSDPSGDAMSLVSPLGFISPIAKQTVALERRLIQLGKDRENIRMLRDQLKPETYKKMMNTSFERLGQAKADYMKWYNRNMGWMWE